MPSFIDVFEGEYHINLVIDSELVVSVSRPFGAICGGVTCSLTLYAVMIVRHPG